MISLAQFESDEPSFEERARAALAVLAGRPGYVGGSLSRSTDEDRWVLFTEWESVGDYRRALGAYEVKLHAAPLLGEALDLPSAFEVLATAQPGGELSRGHSDRA